MRKMIKNKKIYLTIGLIFLILLVTHYRWFFNFSILTYGDWGFFFKENPREFLRLPSFWDSRGLGMFNIGVSMYPAYLLWGALSLIFNFALIERIMYFWPSVIIAGFGSYFLVKKITKSNIAGLIGSFVFVFNTYFFMLKLSHLTLAASFALAPLIILFFIKTLEEKKYYFAVLAGILAFIASFYEARAFYIIVSVLFFYYLYYIFIIDKISLKNIFKNSLFAAIPILIALILNLYWLIPLFGAGLMQNNAIFSPELFGNGFMDILSSLTLFHPFWTGGKVDVFVVQKIPFYFWLIPIFAFLGLILDRKNKNILFFGFIALLGIFLSKQVTEPLGGVYSWLFENFPGFNAFREASKFYFLTALGYSILIGAFIAWLGQNWQDTKWQVGGRYLLLLLISLIFLGNAKPIITGEFGSMFIARHIPNDYLILKDYILSQPEFFRTFWTPNYSRWSIYTNQKPEISNAMVIATEWKGYTSSKLYNNWLENERIMEIFKIKGANELFDNSSIKYVIVPLKDIANDDDFFISYGGVSDPNVRDWYISELDKIEWLKKIDIGTQDLAVYENKNYKPHLYQTQERESVEKNIPFNQVDFQSKSPTEYKITLKNIDRNTYLNFSEAYNENWKLKIGKFSWSQVITNKNYFLADEYHFKNKVQLNSFYLNPEFIKKNLPGEFKENPDGSIDLDLTLYFKPQSYFYLGVIISGATLIGCVGLLIYFWIKQRKKRKNEKTI